MAEKSTESPIQKPAPPTQPPKSGKQDPVFVRGKIEPTEKK